VIRSGISHLPGSGLKRAAPSEVVIPAFGYKNDIGVDRTHGLVRRFTVTHAAAADGRSSGGCSMATTWRAACGPIPPTARRPICACSTVAASSRIPAPQTARQADARAYPARPRPPRSSASQGRARLRRREAPPASGDPDGRHSAGNRQDCPGQSPAWSGSRSEPRQPDHQARRQSHAAAQVLTRMPAAIARLVTSAAKSSLKLRLSGSS
jgi:hypothetical protein